MQNSNAMRSYVLRRMGHKRGFALVTEMFHRAFTADSLANFWRYWNPVYGFYLARYVQRPLKRLVPRPLSVVLTFAFSGFVLHDMLGLWPVLVFKTGVFKPPFVTSWFTLVGLLVVLTEALGVSFAARSGQQRVTIHLVVLAATCALTLWFVGCCTVKLW